MELIDRNALIKQIERTYCDPCTDRKCLYGACHLELALDDIEDAPEVDAEPVKHGRWDMSQLEVFGGLYHCVRECSECGWTYDQVVEFNYCPNCGVKMDEVEA